MEKHSTEAIDHRKNFIIIKNNTTITGYEIIDKFSTYKDEIGNQVTYISSNMNVFRNLFRS